MELVKLTEDEFSKFALENEQATFLQTVYWAKLKEKNGWNWELLGFKKGKKIIAGMMLLSKRTPIKKKMFYAPRGFILDYHNRDLLDGFTEKTREYVKKNNGIFIKIDPYVMQIQRDIDGNIVEGGIDNTDIVKHLKQLGFREQFAKTGQQSLQPKWLYWIPIKGKTIDDILKGMNREKRRIIHNNEKNGVVIREGTYDDLSEFKKIMDHTSERRQFLNRSLEYYQNMYRAFGDGDILKLYFTDLRIEDALVSFKKELETLENNYQVMMEQVNAGVRKVTQETINTKEKEIEKLKKKIEEYEELFKKHGSVLTLGGILFFIYGKEVLAFLGGSYEEYMEFQCSYTIHYEMLKYAIDHNYEYYNFYGISSDLSEKSPMYGVYLFKKGFGGEVVELLGEYDLPISKFYYTIYKISYWIVHKLKKLKIKK